jgi:hypothetical protein
MAKAAPKTKKPTIAPTKRAAPSRIDSSVLAGLLSLLPTPNEAQRRAFRAQFSDTRCAALGDTTRAAILEAEALRFAQGALEVLRGPTAAQVRYIPARLAWLLECVVTLTEQRTQDVRVRSDSSARKSERSVLEQKARLVSSDLSLALQDVAEGDESLLAALRNARAKVSPADDVLGLLDAHTAVLTAWLQGDEAVRTLLASARLDDDTLAAAREAADALRRARSTANTAGNPQVDGPAVNVVEGRVIYEMRLLRKVFNRARERTGDRRIPALTPVPALQRVFLWIDRTESAPDAPTPTPQG